MNGFEGAAATSLATGTGGLEAAARMLPEGTPGWVVAASLLPFAVVVLTSFTRISILLAFLRQGIGLGDTPSPTVLTALAALLTVIAMAPVLDQVQREAVEPWLRGELAAEVARDRGWSRVAGFMQAETRRQDLDLMRRLHAERGLRLEAGSPRVLVPAFVVSELRASFRMGLAIWLPFLVVDLLAAVLVSLSGLALEARLLALPLKLLLFLAVDGWALLVAGMVRSVGMSP